MIPASQLLVNGIAVWRLSRMVVRETGPLHVFADLRERTGIEYGEDGHATSWPDWNPLHCVYCTSVYAAVAVLLMPRPLRLVLATSGVAALMEELSALLEQRAER